MFLVPPTTLKICSFNITLHYNILDAVALQMSSTVASISAISSKARFNEMENVFLFKLKTAVTVYTVLFMSFITESLRLSQECYVKWVCKRYSYNYLLSNVVSRLWSSDLAVDSEVQHFAILCHVTYTDTTQFSYLHSLVWIVTAVA